MTNKQMIYGFFISLAGGAAIGWFLSPNVWLIFLAAGLWGFFVPTFIKKLIK